MLLHAEASALLLVDFQPAFMKAIPDIEPVLARARFLTQVAQALDVPIVVSEQIPDRMGATDSTIQALLGQATPVLAKTSFGCWGDPAWRDAVEGLGRRQLLIAGIETHICVLQTALALLGEGYDVGIIHDAVACRPVGAHWQALGRTQQAGGALVHSESAAYEWLGDSRHPRFKSVLEIVKSSAPVG